MLLCLVIPWVLMSMVHARWLRAADQEELAAEHRDLADSAADDSSDACSFAASGNALQNSRSASIFTFFDFCMKTIQMFVHAVFRILSFEFTLLTRYTFSTPRDYSVYAHLRLRICAESFFEALPGSIVQTLFLFGVGGFGVDDEGGEKTAADDDLYLVLFSAAWSVLQVVRQMREVHIGAKLQTEGNWLRYLRVLTSLTGSNDMAPFGLVKAIKQGAEEIKVEMVGLSSGAWEQIAEAAANSLISTLDVSAVFTQRQQVADTHGELLLNALSEPSQARGLRVLDLSVNFRDDKTRQGRTRPRRIRDGSPPASKGNTRTSRIRGGDSQDSRLMSRMSSDLRRELDLEAAATASGGCLVEKNASSTTRSENAPSLIGFISQQPSPSQTYELHHTLQPKSSIKLKHMSANTNALSGDDATDPPTVRLTSPVRTFAASSGQVQPLSHEPGGVSVAHYKDGGIAHTHQRNSRNVNSVSTQSNLLIVKEKSESTRSNQLATREKSESTRSNQLSAKEQSESTRSNQLATKEKSDSTRSNLLSAKELSDSARSNQLVVGQQTSTQRYPSTTSSTLVGNQPSLTTECSTQQYAGQHTRSCLSLSQSSQAPKNEKVLSKTNTDNGSGRTWVNKKLTVDSLRQGAGSSNFRFLMNHITSITKLSSERLRPGMAKKQYSLKIEGSRCRLTSKALGHFLYHRGGVLHELRSAWNGMAEDGAKAMADAIEKKAEEDEWLQDNRRVDSGEQLLEASTKTVTAKGRLLDNLFTSVGSEEMSCSASSRRGTSPEVVLTTTTGNFSKDSHLESVSNRDSVSNVRVSSVRSSPSFYTGILNRLNPWAGDRGRLSVLPDDSSRMEEGAIVNPQRSRLMRTLTNITESVLTQKHSSSVQADKGLTLVLSGNSLRGGILHLTRALERVAWSSRLRSLRLDGNGIDSTGANCLFKITKVCCIQHLNLHWNRIGTNANQGPDLDGMSNESVLSVSDGSATSKKVRARCLRLGPLAESLETLVLSQNRLDCEAFLKFEIDCVSIPGAFSRLRVLDIGRNSGMGMVLPSVIDTLVWTCKALLAHRSCLDNEVSPSRVSPMFLRAPNEFLRQPYCLRRIDGWTSSSDEHCCDQKGRYAFQRC